MRIFRLGLRGGGGGVSSPTITILSFALTCPNTPGICVSTNVLLVSMSRATSGTCVPLTSMVTTELATCVLLLLLRLRGVTSTTNTNCPEGSESFGNWRLELFDKKPRAASQEPMQVHAKRKSSFGLLVDNKAHSRTMSFSTDFVCRLPPRMVTASIFSSTSTTTEAYLFQIYV